MAPHRSHFLALTLLAALAAHVAARRAATAVYPPPGDVFRALALCPLDRVRVVILGQDPYHGPGQAHGLSFRCVGEGEGEERGVRIVASLRSHVLIVASCQPSLPLATPRHTPQRTARRAHPALPAQHPQGGGI
jgi:uracil DNA glycosylase